MRESARRIAVMVDHLAHEVTTTILLGHGWRLSPATLEKLRRKFLDALQAARLLGELHGFDTDDEAPPTAASITDTAPGLPHSKRPPKH